MTPVTCLFGHLPRYLPVPVAAPLWNNVKGEHNMKAHGIDLEQDAIRQFCKKWKIRELRVFGSILRDDFNADSDVDFLADWDEDVEWDAFDHMDMEDQLAEI